MSDRTPISVALLDPGDVSRLGCRTIFEGDERFRVAVDPSRAADLVTRRPAEIDLVVLDPAVDLSFDEFAVERVARALPNASILLFTDAHVPVFASALQDGVRGYLVKAKTNARLLLDAAYIVGSQAGVVFDRELFDSSVAGASSDTLIQFPGLYDVTITWREREILKLLSQGFADEMIARHLGVARTTVHTHVSSLLRKTQLLNRVQLGIWALRAGIIDIAARSAGESDLKKAA